MPLEGGKVCLDLGFGLDAMRPSAFLASGDGDRCLPDKHRPSSTRVHQPTSLRTSLSRSGEWSDSGDRERRTGSSSRTPNLEKTLRLLGGLGSSSKSRGSGLFLSLPLLGEPSVKDTWRLTVGGTGTGWAILISFSSSSLTRLDKSLGLVGDGDPKSSASLSDLSVGCRSSTGEALPLAVWLAEALGGVQPVGISGKEISGRFGELGTDTVTDVAVRFAVLQGGASTTAELSITSDGPLAGGRSAESVFSIFPATVNDRLLGENSAVDLEGDLFLLIAIPALIVAAILACLSIIS